MKVHATSLPGVSRIEPDVFGDERGWFLETWRAERFAEQGLPERFCQANTSRSARGVLRGLHYQWPEPQGKLVWVTEGTVLDVAVDLRTDSPHFRQWVAVELSEANHQQLWIPEGFGHGFQVLSEHATFSYLCTRPYRPEYDASIAWNDPAIGVEWPLEPSSLSGKDSNAPRLDEVAPEELPKCEYC